MEVTVLIAISVGAKTVLAKRSQKTQKTAPITKLAGITKYGLELFSMVRVIWGTAIPTKETGPAIAVTVADSMLESKMSITQKGLILIPILFAYPSPREYASIGFDISQQMKNAGIHIAALKTTLSQSAPEKVPIDHPVRFKIS